MKTISFCEIDPFCRRVLAKHWPEVHCYHDVRELSAQHLTADGHGDIDLICGGFPCQDISVAGRGAGIVGERSGLWNEMLRLIDETRPAWVIVENSVALRSRGLETLLRGLASVGYDAEWHCIPAAALGAPHQRDRIWIVAYPTISGRQTGTCTKVDAAGTQGLLQFGGLDSEMARAYLSGDCLAASAATCAEPWLDREDAGTAGRLDAHMASRIWEGAIPRTVPTGSVDRVPRVRALGNSLVPQIPELIGRAIMAVGTEMIERAT